ncbi:peptide deformylase [Candidatus Kaiserbacteria bacterium]|nr:peptide deformylase [Candidatus Kaiserbacteria bacterium]
MYRIIPQDENPALRQQARELSADEINSPYLHGLIAEMKELLSHEEFGVALAAPQVGEAVRLFIVSGAALARDKAGDESSPAEPMNDQVYINPAFTRMSRGTKLKHEGCLSIRGKWGHVPRAEKATLRALDEHGNPFTRNASGFLAHIFQHEMDHLDGILYVDKAEELYDDDKKEEPQE